MCRSLTPGDGPHGLCKIAVKRVKHFASVKIYRYNTACIWGMDHVVIVSVFNDVQQCRLCCLRQSPRWNVWL